MIIFVEIPHQGRPTVWGRDTRENVIRVIQASSQDTPVWCADSGREILDGYNCTTTDELREDCDDDVTADMIDQHGLDTLYYETWDSGGYTPEAVDEYETCLAYCAHDLNGLRVYESKDEAIAAVKDESAWRIHSGVQARIELERYLREAGVLEDSVSTSED